MLNRRILRIKAFKELFAIEMSAAPSLNSAQKELDVALESTRNLYVFMLGAIPALKAVAQERITQLDRKINKTEEEKNPNRKFVDNALSRLLENDPDFQKIFKKRGYDWGAYDLILKRIFSSIRQKEYFRSYMSMPGSSLPADCTLFKHIFEEEFVDREDLLEALEDLNIYWNDDLAYSLTWCCRTLDDLARGDAWRLPPLYMSDIDSGKEDDNAFVHKLLQEAYINYQAYYGEVSKVVPNWDSERFVGTDIALIITALAEIVHFPNIPVNVSINEYVEISKYFGTPKSSVFVNGILDALCKKVEFQKNKL